MVKSKDSRKSQRQRFTSFKNGFCPYCGSSGATLEEVTSKKGGYRGACINPACKAENFFSNPKTREWIKE